MTEISRKMFFSKTFEKKMNLLLKILVALCLLFKVGQGTVL